MKLRISRQRNGPMEHQYTRKTIPVTSCAIKFTMTVESLKSYADYPEIYLSASECPHVQLYMVSFDYLNKKISLKIDDWKVISIKLPDILLSLQCHELWASWYYNCFRLGFVNSNAFLEYQNSSKREINPICTGPSVGFVTFKNKEKITFKTKDFQVCNENIFRHIEGGELRWVSMTSGKQLPFDALIGGFQGEPIYIARAMHGGLLVPGKYIPSKQLAFLPWGHTEYPKRDFEILCGYNAMWIKCDGSYLPSNSFKAGISEVKEETLYIGRAMVNDDLVVGKVHVVHNTCYIPNDGLELARTVFEILAVGNSKSSEFNWKKQCFMLNCKKPQSQVVQL